MKSAEGLLSKIASCSNEGELNVLSKWDINGFTKHPPVKWFNNCTRYGQNFGWDKV